MKREKMIYQIWIMAAEIAESNSRKVDFSNFYSKYSGKSKPPEDIVDEAMKTLNTPESVNKKIHAKQDGVLGKDEFDEVVKVFRLLIKWRDENKNSIGSQLR